MAPNKKMIAAVIPVNSPTPFRLALDGWERRLGAPDDVDQGEERKMRKMRFRAHVTV